MPAALSDQQPLPRLGQVTDYILGGGIDHRGADRHRQLWAQMARTTAVRPPLIAGAGAAAHLAGVVAAIAGVLFASKGSIDPSTGLLGIKAFAAAVLGGIGNITGAMLGGLIIGMVEIFGAGYISGQYKDVFAFIILISVLYFKPTGIMGENIDDTRV